jgi:hypothetical protein
MFEEGCNLLEMLNPRISDTHMSTCTYNSPTQNKVLSSCDGAEVRYLARNRKAKGSSPTTAMSSLGDWFAQP